jgi:hypothetical protein
MDESSVSALRFFRNRRKGYATKNPAGALHPDLAGVCYRVGWEIKMEIPVNIRVG